MTPLDAIMELLGRVGVNKDAEIVVNDEELRQWPAAAVKAMKSQRLIKKARPASSALCPGCERDCLMPVHSLPALAGASESFVVCDKRRDINRVVIPPGRLTQWLCSADLVCRFVATNLDLRFSNRQLPGTDLWEIGVVFGEKRSQMLCLQKSTTLSLVAGNNSLPLAEILDYHDGAYSLDRLKIRQLVDSATTTDPRYTPSKVKREARKQNTQAMYDSWRKAYRNLRKRRPNRSDVWYSLQIAKMDLAKGRNPETIRKQMKK